MDIYYDNQNLFNKATKKYKTALNKYGSYATDNQKSNTYWLLSGALYFNKQYKEGFEYQDTLINFKEKLFTIEKNKTFERLQTEYEVEKKDNQIRFLEKEQALEAQRKKLIVGIGGALLGMLSLLVFVYYNRVKTQKIIRKQEQQLFNQEKEQLAQDQKIKRIEGYIEGEEREKNRIAIELHDGIGGQLSGIKHYVSSLPKNTENDILLKNIGFVSKEVRLLSHSLSTNFSTQQPLTNLLQTLKLHYVNHFTVDYIVFPEDAITQLNNTCKQFIYRTIQELLNNTYKYANATEVSVSLTLTDEIVLLVEDNGTGFTDSTKATGIGLTNIKEKLTTFQGTLSIDSSPEIGSTIIIKFPNTNATHNTNYS